MRLLELSNCGCLPGKAGESPFCTSDNCSAALSLPEGLCGGRYSGTASRRAVNTPAGAGPQAQLAGVRLRPKLLRFVNACLTPVSSAPAEPAPPSASPQAPASGGSAMAKDELLGGCVILRSDSGLPLLRASGHRSQAPLDLDAVDAILGQFCPGTAKFRGGGEGADQHPVPGLPRSCGDLFYGGVHVQQQQADAHRIRVVRIAE